MEIENIEVEEVVEQNLLDDLAVGAEFSVTNYEQFQCANCSHIDFQPRKFTDFTFTETDPGGSGQEIKLTVLQAISEIFNIKLEPLLISCYDDLKLCSACGDNLVALYKCFKQFTQFSTVDSVITGLLKMDPNNTNHALDNETKKSLRKNPKQLVRFEMIDTISPKRPNRFAKLQMGSSPGTSSQEYMEPRLKEEIESDDYDETEDGNTEDANIAASSEPNTGILFLGVTEDGQYDCLQCGKAFPTKGGMILHLRFKHQMTKDEAQEQCKHPSIAGQVRRFGKLEKLEIKRKRKSVPREDRIPLPCPHCHKSSWNQRDLNNHISSVHLKIKPFSCPTCDKPFSRKQQVEAHLKVHSGEKTSLCFLCGKSYSSPGALKGHLDRHFPKSAPPANPVKFKCNLCDVYCTDMRRLNEHKLRHQDERNFPCEHCEKAFKTRRDLVKHRNYHKLKVEKPEQCPACEKRYSTKEILKFHLHSTHHYTLEDARAAAGIGQAAVVVYDDVQNVS